jgi:branched-chain amino acid transport system substrate-binding protein
MAVTAGLLMTSGFAGVSAKQPSAGPVLHGTINIAQITSITGAYAPYGVMQEDGFRAGLAYATHGTDKVLGAKIKVTDYNDVDPNGFLPDPVTAVKEARQALAAGANFIQCCPDSTSAYDVATDAQGISFYKRIDMVAPAADDSLTGVNRYTFRTSREDTQDAMTGAGYAVKKFGKTFMTMAQNYSFGQNQEKVWDAQLKRLKATDKGDILFPLNATDFTPYITQVKNAKPKWLFVACAGTQCTGLFNQFKSEGLFKAGIRVMTGLPNIGAFPSFGSAVSSMGFLSVYYYTFPHTAANTYLKKYIEKNYKRPADIFDQDAFAAAQQLVAAIAKAKSLNSTKLIHALEGQTVQGPKGPYTIRAKDHACIQPMYITRVKSENGGTKLVPILLKTVTPKPPVVKTGW